MFKKIVVAYNDSPESERALHTAIQLAESLNAELHTVSVVTHLPAYTAFAAIDASWPQVLQEDQVKAREVLKQKAFRMSQGSGIEIRNHDVEGDEIEVIVNLLYSEKADLLVVGLHKRDLYVARLWSTVYELAHESPCSILGVP